MRPSAQLLALDGDLGKLLGEERRSVARDELLVRLHNLRTGEWHADRLAGADPGHVGLLILEGMLVREVVIADTVSAELIGPGDLVRPWSLDGSPRLLRSEARWMVLAPSRLAILDAAFGRALVRYPEINAVLIDRLSERAQRLATTQAISQLNRVDQRLVALFWHLAERWGRVGSGGIIVPLGLSHRMLAQLVGARRPTVSTALGDLARRGEIIRRDDGTWILAGEPAGLPRGEAARVVRGRRKVLPVEPLSRPGVPPAMVASPMPQMRDALDQLREAHARGSDELMLPSEPAEQPRDLREQVVRDRAARFARED